MGATERNKFGRLMTPEEAADFLQVEVSTVKQWAKLGKIPHRRAGVLIRFDRDELDAWTRRGGRSQADADEPGKADGSDDAARPEAA